MLFLKDHTPFSFNSPAPLTFTLIELSSQSWVDVCFSDFCTNVTSKERTCHKIKINQVNDFTPHIDCTDILQWIPVCHSEPLWNSNIISAVQWKVFMGGSFDRISAHRWDTTSLVWCSLFPCSLTPMWEQSQAVFVIHKYSLDENFNFSLLLKTFFSYTIYFNILFPLSLWLLPPPPSPFALQIHSFL